MTKADLVVLGKVFACEIQGCPFQSKSKRVKKLAEDGYLEFYQGRDANNRFVMTWEEYRLTHKGRLAYCESC